MAASIVTYASASPAWVGRGSEISLKRGIVISLTYRWHGGDWRQATGAGALTFEHKTGIVERRDRSTKRDQDRRAVGQPLLQNTIQRLLGVRIQAGGCLIHEDPIRFRQQRPGEG